MATNSQASVPADVRAAIVAFLDHCQTEVQPFATAEAIGAIRRIYPGMELSDADLMDAMVGEAAAAGFDIEFDPARTAATLKRNSLERWDNEGGAIGQPVKPPQ